jgi:pyrroline-5-carboxylate reductase
MLLKQVIRVMPNTPSLVQQGATVYSLGTHATSADAEIVEKIFSGVGECFRVNVSKTTIS